MTVAAAVIAKRERDAVDAFRRARATSPDRAQPLYAVGLEESHIVSRLQSRAVLRSASPGALYLDEPSWEVLRRTRRRVMLVAVAVALALGATGIWTALQAR